jgi:uncharacterized protein YndB with AHSA1/START domain
MTSIITIALAAALVQQGFERVGENKGVVVYRKANTKTIELGAEGELPAPPARVLALLTDYEHHRRWVKNLAESQVLGRSDGSIDVYQRLSLPVVSDRDFTLHVTFGEEGEVRWVRTRTDNSKGPPPKSGVVRISTNECEWRLEPTADGKRTIATYRLNLDLGGSIPGWIARDHALRDVPGLFEAMRKELSP